MADELFARFIAYMNQVIYHARVDYLRKAKRTIENEIMLGKLPEVAFYDDPTLESSSLSQLTSHSTLNNALASLSENEQIVLFFLICRQMSVSIAAERLGMSPGSLYRIKRRALQKLKKQLIGGNEHV